MDAMGQITVIGEYLRLVRREHGMTQEQFVEQLSVAVKEFQALNTVTLSRWETGSTSPSYKKKRELLKYCSARGWQSDGACRDFVRSRFEQLYKSLSGIFQHNYKSLIANVPELRVPLEEYGLVDLQQASDIDYFEHIVDIETASNPEGYYSVTSERLRRLCHHPASFSILCERKKQHMGHFVMFKLKNENAERLVHRKLDENDVSEDDLCPPDEIGSYYIHALYGINPTLAALVNSRAYIYLFDNKEMIDNICIFSSRPDGMRLARAYGIKTVARGKHREYGFTWYGMQSPVEDILFSDTVLKLIF
jgi:transcriptional regulator with XRE-family HTH domain